MTLTPFSVNNGNIEELQAVNYPASSTKKFKLGNAQCLSIPVALLSLLCAASACTSPPPKVAAPPPPPPPPAEHIPPPLVAKPTESPTITLKDVGFKTPESVYYDKKRDVYLVSNINGSPFEKNGKGFISLIKPDGELTLKFIEGGKSGVTLHAPKGLTVSGDTLYVADIDRVVLFDAQTGKPKGDLKLKGSTFVNDLATGAGGRIYVSDSGYNAQWASSGTEAIYVIIDKKVRTLLADKKKLGNPNGLLAGEGGVWVVAGSGELYWISDDGKLSHNQIISTGGNDGIVHTDDGRTLISSWKDEAIFSGIAGRDFVVEISGLEAPADIGLDCKRNRLLIPLFKKDIVILHPLSDAVAAPVSESKQN